MVGLVLQFVMLAAVVAVAGTFLARAADAIAEVTGLGRMLVGSILLAAATSLPELTVDIAAVRAGMADLAAGDLLGSSLMNLLILAVVDMCQRDGRKMLSREAASHALSATLAIALTALAAAAVLTAGKLPSIAFLGIGGWSWAILGAYLLGARMLFIDQRISARAAAGSCVVADRRVRDGRGRAGGGGPAAGPRGGRVGGTVGLGGHVRRHDPRCPDDVVAGTRGLDRRGAAGRDRSGDRKHVRQ